MFSPRDRELSAKRHAIKKLENSLMETKRELSDLKKENRLLNRLQIRQEKELNRFQTQEGELPEILARHAEEVGRKRNYELIYTYIHDTVVHVYLHVQFLYIHVRIQLNLCMVRQPPIYCSLIVVAPCVMHLFKQPPLY